MRQVTRKSLVTVAAAGGVLALSGGSALADSTAEGGAAHSPGVLSGNSAQAPVHVPVNACGNTVNVVGALNPAMGNSCANQGSGHGGHGEQDGPGEQGGSGGHGGGAHAEGGAQNSPGVGSGNNVQVPVDVPVNACGNTVDVVGALNPAMGNQCANGQAPHDEQPPSETPNEPEAEAPEKPEDKPGQPEGRPEGQTEAEAPDSPEQRASAPEPKTATRSELAQTGSDLGLGLSLSAGLLLGGAVLYRRARAAARR